MVDILSIIIGFGIGVVVVAIAVEFGTKKNIPGNPTSKRAYNWDISEISNPKIMAEYLGDIPIPSQAKVLVNKYKDKARFEGMKVKQSTQIKGNYILGDDRALILSGPVKENEVGFWTIDKEIVKTLHQEFDTTWQNAHNIKLD